jgi:hypothetical protein
MLANKSTALSSPNPMDAEVAGLVGVAFSSSIPPDIEIAGLVGVAFSDYSGSGMFILFCDESGVE